MGGGDKTGGRSQSGESAGGETVFLKHEPGKQEPSLMPQFAHLLNGAQSIGFLSIMRFEQGGL